MAVAKTAKKPVAKKTAAAPKSSAEPKASKKDYSDRIDHIAEISATRCSVTTVDGDTFVCHPDDIDATFAEMDNPTPPVK